MDPAGQPAIAISQAFATPKVYDELEGLAFEASTYFGDPSQLVCVFLYAYLCSFH